MQRQQQHKYNQYLPILEMQLPTTINFHQQTTLLFSIYHQQARARKYTFIDLKYKNCQTVTLHVITLITKPHSSVKLHGN